MYSRRDLRHDTIRSSLLSPPLPSLSRPQAARGTPVFFFFFAYSKLATLAFCFAARMVSAGRRAMHVALLIRRRSTFEFITGRELQEEAGGSLGSSDV